MNKKDLLKRIKHLEEIIEENHLTTVEDRTKEWFGEDNVTVIPGGVERIASSEGLKQLSEALSGPKPPKNKILLKIYEWAEKGLSETQEIGTRGERAPYWELEEFLLKLDK